MFNGPIGTITVLNEDTTNLNGIDDFGYDVPPCTLDLALAYAGGTLTLNFDLGLTAPASWNLWLVLGNAIVPLWTGLGLPAIQPPLQFPLPFGFPQVGTIGMLTTLTTPGDGIICSDFGVVDTGQP